MADARKKWRLQLIPIFAYHAQASRAAAYRNVDYHRDRYASGRSRVHQVNVEVDDGTGWALFERIVFPERGVSR